MKKYKSIALMVADLKNGNIPADVVSPGAAASLIGITRQSVQNRLYDSESLEAWSAEGIILISSKSIQEAIRKKRNIPETQGELNVSTQ